MKKILIGSLIVIGFLGSCTKSNDTQYTCDPNYDPCAIKAPASETDSVKAYINAHIDSILAHGDTVRHCSGMYYVIEKDSAGTGKTPEVCSYVSVKYTGMLKDSSLFANNLTGNFYLSQLITGFKNGLELIKEGGVINLYIPPSLAYGSQQNGNIPANSMLIFKVTLILVQ
jgi:FKBP-type peptidyl-prolyl cis-trans isomerase FkpA